MELLVISLVGGLIGIAIPLALFAICYPRLMFWLDDRAFRRQWQAKWGPRRAQQRAHFDDVMAKLAALDGSR